MKKNNYFLVFVVFVLLVFIFYIYIKVADFNPENTNDLILQKINRLELKIDSLNNKKDSIRTIIDSTHVKIITNEKHYKERINTILVQSSSSDSCFITDYIRQYSEQNPLSNFK